MVASGTRVHFVGIGGAGMAPLAEYLKHKGCEVSGSDIVPNKLTHRLEKEGVCIQYDHNPGAVRDSDLIVYTSAVTEDNPEISYALNNGKECIKRSVMLGKIMEGSKTLCVSGTHGKTTVTAMTGHILKDQGIDCTVIVGGTIKGTGSNISIGKESCIIAEADEYDRSFLNMKPDSVLINNIEPEHLDIYDGLDDIINTYTEFALKAGCGGKVFLNGDDDNCQNLKRRLESGAVTYGRNEVNDYRLTSINDSKNGIEVAFLDKYGNKASGDLPVFGVHNAMNAAGAIAAVSEYGVGLMDAFKSLRSFEGVERRYQKIAVINGCDIILDYAHHPSEISSSVDAARLRGYKSINLVFQPHLYSRTRHFLDEFAASLSSADRVWIAPVYEARKEHESIPVSSEAIKGRMEDKGFEEVNLIDSIKEVPDVIRENAGFDEVFLLLGAGDIVLVQRELTGS
ncbi:MAG: UDP-N-acetylmuramate--L-alanine ligase [Chitinivibrionales bacterium]